MAVAVNGKELPVITVFAFALRHFKEAAINQISTYSAHDVDPDDIKWVITVPAIWDDGAKQIMREAAYEVGAIINKIYLFKLGQILGWSCVQRSRGKSCDCLRA